MIKVGDEVVTKNPFYYKNENLGDRLGTVIDVNSYIMVYIHEYHSNPVKCFRNEIEVISQRHDDDSYFDHFDQMFDDMIRS